MGGGGRTGPCCQCTPWRGGGPAGSCGGALGCQGGWSARVALCDVIFSCQEIATRAEAEARLRELGVDPEVMVIFEDVEEDELD